mmetsp:Transcript_30277/g.59483  ORF Transcript_30277/g.59483 Transcript_30277/m.59483 type:complete len:95 (+) Transcript_30277:221-505(+)
MWKRPDFLIFASGKEDRQAGRQVGRQTSLQMFRRTENFFSLVVSSPQQSHSTQLESVRALTRPEGRKKNKDTEEEEEGKRQFHPSPHGLRDRNN